MDMVQSKQISQPANLNLRGEKYLETQQVSEFCNDSLRFEPL